MRGWSAERVAEAAGARLVRAGDRPGGPERVVIDSRQAGPGALFAGLAGQRTDGGLYAPGVLRAGAWGVLTTPAHAQAALDAQPETAPQAATGAVLTAPDPLRAIQSLARAWRRELDARVIGVTGSTGKTSTKDILHALLAPHRRTVASRGNFNTEVGLPLEICNAPQGTEVLVLEMAMRGPGQIAELADIAEPEVGVIVSIGPVHLELLGSLAAIAAAKAELIAGLPSGGTAIIPAHEPLLAPHLRDDVSTVTFGEGGAVRLARAQGGRVEIEAEGERIELLVPFTQAHMRQNLLAAVAAAQAVGVTPGGRIELSLSPGRGGLERLPGDIALVDDCYNANPMSMRAALDELASAPAGGVGRRLAVLGDMLELGPEASEFHAQIGRYARERGVDLLVTVGPLAKVMGETFAGETHVTADAAEAAAVAAELVRPGDTVLVKASRGIGLEVVCDALRHSHASRPKAAS